MGLASWWRTQIRNPRFGLASKCSHGSNSRRQLVGKISKISWTNRSSVCPPQLENGVQATVGSASWWKEILAQVKNQGLCSSAFLAELGFQSAFYAHSMGLGRRFNPLLTQPSLPELPWKSHPKVVLLGTTITEQRRNLLGSKVRLERPGFGQIDRGNYQMNKG